MRSPASAEENRAASLAAPSVPWRTVAVEALPGFRLRVRFEDGVEGLVDMAELVRSPAAGVFAALSDPGRFSAVFLDRGVVCWPGEIDLAPDAMHAAIVASGRWTLT